MEPARGRSDLLRHRLIGELARVYDVTPAQVVLRWHVQRGTIPIPKSADPQRQAQNLEVFGFGLSDAEMTSMARLDRSHRLGGDPDTYEEF